MAGIRGEKGHDRQQRHDGEVFEQQDRDHPLATRRRHLALLLQQLHDDRGGGEHEAHSGDEGLNDREADRHAEQHQEQAADGNLRGAEAEYVTAQPPKARRLHFEADDEEEHDDAEFGDVEDRTRIGEELQAPGADGEAGGEIAEDRSEPQPLEDRHRDDARAEQRDDGDEFARERCMTCRF